MKRVTGLVAFLLAIGISPVSAGYLEDVRNLGYVSGEGLACGASRYGAYETVARAYLVSSARSDKEQESGMYEYNSAKAKAYMRKRGDGLFDCEEINSRFNRQKIFQAKLYKNGTLKMPDGKVIKPRQEYDATLLYDRDSNEREHLNTYYDKIMAKRRKQAQKEGIYNKIRQAEAEALR